MHENHIRVIYDLPLHYKFSHVIRTATIFFILINTWLLYSHQTYSQRELFGVYKATGPDTIFYPFYNGIQMIEIDYEGEWQRNVDYHEATQPRAMPWSALIPKSQPNLYLFRNLTGEIVKAFNTHQTLNYLTQQFSKVSVTRKTNGYQDLFSCHHCRKAFHAKGFGYGRQSNYWFGGFYLIHSMKPVMKKENNSQYAKRSNEPVGLIDSFGNIVLPVVYSGIFPVNDDLLVMKDNKCGIINKKQQAILPLEYDHYDMPTEEDIVFTSKGKFSCIYNIPGRKITYLDDYDWIDYDLIRQIRRSDLKPAERPPLIAVRKNEKTGLLDLNFKERVAPVYDYCLPVFRNGRARVNRGKKWGYINQNGKEVIPCRYDDATDFYEGHATVILDGARICIDENNNRSGSCNISMSKWEVTRELGDNGTFINGRRIVRRMQLEGVINDSGHVVIPLIYDDIIGIRDNIPGSKWLQEFYKVRRFGKSGVIDKNGGEILPVVYDHIGDFNSDIDMITIGKQGLYGLADKSFKIMLPVKYESLSPYQVRDKIIFSENKLYGWMEMDGKVIVPPQYDETGWMHDGKIRVKKGKLYGIVDVQGKEIIPIQFQQVNDKFYNGLVTVNKSGKWGFLDSVAKVVIPFRYDELRNFEKKITGAKKNGKFGFIDRAGKEVTGYRFDFIGHSWGVDRLVMVRSNGKIGYVDETGKEAIPCIYDDENGFGPEKGHHMKLNDKWMWVKP